MYVDAERVSDTVRKEGVVGELFQQLRNRTFEDSEVFESVRELARRNIKYGANLHPWADLFDRKLLGS